MRCFPLPSAIVLLPCFPLPSALVPLPSEGPNPFCTIPPLLGPNHCIIRPSHPGRCCPRSHESSHSLDSLSLLSSLFTPLSSLFPLLSSLVPLSKRTLSAPGRPTWDYTSPPYHSLRFQKAFKILRSSVCCSLASLFCLLPSALSLLSAQTPLLCLLFAFLPTSCALQPLVYAGCFLRSLV